MQELLAKKGVWGIVDGTAVAPTVPPPTSTNGAIVAAAEESVQVFTSKIAKAKRLIYSSVSDEDIVEIRTMTPHAMWARLQNEHATTSRGQKEMALRKLKAFRMKEGESFVRMRKRYRARLSDCATAGVTLTAEEKLFQLCIFPTKALKQYSEDI